MTRAPHALYGHVGVHEVYSVGRYQQDAAAVLSVVRGMGRIPVFTGGTGLYFAALCDGLANVPAVPAAVRDAARRKLDAIGVGALHAELAARDPDTAARLRATDPQRVLRAYEVLEATGLPLAHWQLQMGTPLLAGLRVARFVLDLPREQLRERIATRFEAMLAHGAIAEATALSGLDPALPAAKILGLRELQALAAGEMAAAEAVRLAVTATRQFAKRQTTWFRNRMADWIWLPAQDSGNILPAIMPHVS
jgi:tRNA dimethylallyltransferase